MAKKEITITLHKSELLYDVENKTHLVGSSLSGGEGRESVVQADDRGEARGQVLRSLSSSFERASVLLTEYLDARRVEARDLLLDEEGVLRLKLKMPENYDEGATKGVATALHDYVVGRTLVEWSGLVLPAKREVFVGATDEAMKNLIHAVSRRKRPSREDRR